MSSHAEMDTLTEDTSAPHAERTASGMRGDMHWLLRHFVAEVAGVTHAVLLSRDGLRLLDSEVDKDWADKLSAGISGIASIANNFTGPSKQKRPASQVIIERDDCLIFVQSAGGSTAFDNHPGGKTVTETVLGVVTTTDADAGNVGFEIGRLVQKFATYMQIPVRDRSDDEAR
ncbi:roadblock/LC7 domain-containing protein [Streptomyces sp. NPDC001828]|uniref:roadblock/LC7 domain-containing protein n=1 Tax=Streptomyces sp. NPDC001828 TaxID=3364615 RepID=UPI0036CA2ED4